MQLTYVFPILILLFIGLFFFGCPSPASAVIENAPKSAFGRRDAIALGIITSVYAVTAFIGLGDTDAPQSFHDFHSGESVTVDLGEVRSIAMPMQAGSTPNATRSDSESIWMP